MLSIKFYFIPNVVFSTNFREIRNYINRKTTTTTKHKVRQHISEQIQSRHWKSTKCYPHTYFILNPFLQLRNQKCHLASIARELTLTRGMKLFWFAQCRYIWLNLGQLQPNIWLCIEAGSVFCFSRHIGRESWFT